MKSHKTVKFSFWILSIVFLAGATQAQTSAIGVIDIQTVLKSSAAARSIRPQMDQLKQKYEKKFRKAETKLRRLKQDLRRERAVLPEGYPERFKAFQRRVREKQREIQTVNRLIDRAFANSMRKVNQALRDITMEVAQERLLQFVLPKRSLIFYDKQFDITKIVSERLNKRLSKVLVVMPKIRQKPAKK